MTDCTHEAPASDDGRSRSEYHEGRKAFWDGVSLRFLAALVERDDLDAEEREKTELFVLGYADAALDALRRASGVACELSGPVGS